MGQEDFVSLILAGLFLQAWGILGGQYPTTYTGLGLVAYGLAQLCRIGLGY
jgi:hypothetical protein